MKLIDVRCMQIFYKEVCFLNSRIMFKRFVSFFVSAVLCVALPMSVPGLQQSARNRRLSLERLPLMQENSVSVDVKISGNPGISAMVLEIEYDTSRLSLESVEKYSELVGMFEYTKKAVWVYCGDTTYDGTIFTINFKVLDSAKIGNAEITILYEEGDICNYNEQTVDFDIVSGGITVVNGGTGAADNTIASTDSSRENSVSTGDVEENTKNTRNSLQGIIIPIVIAFAAVIAVVCVVVAVKREKNDSK